MTRLAAPIVAPDPDTARARAARAAEQGADLLELRLDALTEPGPEAVARMLGETALPAIVTCRAPDEGGLAEISDEDRLDLLESALDARPPPAYLDVELATRQRNPERVGRFEQRLAPSDGGTTGLILSSHDLEGRPRDLYQRVETMAAVPAARVLKIAWRARSLRDNLEAFELLARAPKPAIVLCMGEEGLPSRVLAPKFGGLVTFAAVSAEEATASGQPTLAAIKSRYRWDALGPRTRVYGVIGHPVGHSKSPAIHNAGFEATGHDGVYLPMPVTPSYEGLKATLGGWIEAPGLDLTGASVTLPHKEHLLAFVREAGGEIEPLAERIGAGNTLSFAEDGRPVATNTDYAAALDAVCAGMGIGRDGLAGKRVAVLGAGGAARAAVAGFASVGATVVVYNRTLEKARSLAAAFDGSPGQVVAAEADKVARACCDVFINCTPLGMAPETDATPMPDGARSWGPGTVVFDTIYNPPRTRLLADAADAGCHTIPGGEMFVRQAAAQFQTWTGLAAPLETFRAVMEL